MMGEEILSIETLVWKLLKAHKSSCDFYDEMTSQCTNISTFCVLIFQQHVWVFWQDDAIAHWVIALLWHKIHRLHHARKCVSMNKQIEQRLRTSFQTIFSTTQLRQCKGVVCLIYTYCLQHERPCCIGYTNSSRRREFVYPIQHGRECCKWLKKRLILWVNWRSNFKNKRCLKADFQSSHEASRSSLRVLASN
jgi:hypothetical protein